MKPIAGAPHFTLAEFGRAGAPVPRRQVADVELLARRYLEPLRRRFGRTIVVSGYRTTRRNAAVGGAPLSMHLSRRRRRGAAADVVCERGTPAEWFAFLDELGAPGLGLYSGHVHVDTRTGPPARWKA